MDFGNAEPGCHFPHSLAGKPRSGEHCQWDDVKATVASHSPQLQPSREMGVNSEHPNHCPDGCWEGAEPQALSCPCVGLGLLQDWAGQQAGTLQMCLRAHTSTCPCMAACGSMNLRTQPKTDLSYRVRPCLRSKTCTGICQTQALGDGSLVKCLPGKHEDPAQHPQKCRHGSHTSVPALRRQRPSDLCEIGDSLGYIVSCWPAKACDCPARRSGACL